MDTEDTHKRILAECKSKCETKNYKAARWGECLHDLGVDKDFFITVFPQNTNLKWKGW